jgi:hypothetical protein
MFSKLCEAEARALCRAARIPHAEQRPFCELELELLRFPATRRFGTRPGPKTFFGGGGPMRVRKSQLGFTNPELADECAAHGLKKGGGRFELVLRLVSAGLGEQEDYLVEY